jgi:AcrR family transcriptional regulator
MTPAHTHKASPHASTRRTEGVLTGGRSARVVDTVLHAAAEQLSKVGYGAFRVEDVAERSGVNKTTIYRRWPSKAELVAAALAAVSPQVEVRRTGHFRDDLLEAVRHAIAFASSPTGRGLIRIMQSEAADPEVERIAEELRSRQRAARVELVRSAIEHGDLPAGVDPEFVSELVFAPIFMRMLASREQVSDAVAEQIVDTVLAGVRAVAKRGRGAHRERRAPR